MDEKQNQASQNQPLNQGATASARPVNQGPGQPPPPSVGPQPATAPPVGTGQAAGQTVPPQPITPASGGQAQQPGNGANGGSNAKAQPTKKGIFSFFKSSDKAEKKKQISTQDAILISEIRDGLVIMRDGSLRSVVMCQSINFDLMSPQERESVEASYQGFLNSLYFPIQIFIRSQRVDLNKYIDKLKEIHSNQENVLLGLLMEDYIAYVRYLIEAANVMDKQFYITVPYYPPLISQEGLATGLRKLTAIFKPKSGPITINEADYTRYKSELAQRVQVILNGMNQLGVQAVPLNTQELIELYYSVYNPETASQERLVDVSELEAPIVEKGQGQAEQVLHGERSG